MIAQKFTGYKRHAVTTRIGGFNTNRSGTDGVALSKTTMAWDVMMDIAVSHEATNWQLNYLLKKIERKKKCLLAMSTIV